MHRCQEHLRRLKEGACEALWPTRCVGCDALGELLCPRCRSLLAPIDQALACPRCGAPFGRLVCTECTDCLVRDDDEGAGSAGGEGSDAARAPRCLEAVRSFGMLEWPLDRMVRAYKDAGERRLAVPLGRALALAARQGYGARLEQAAGVAFVPCTPRAYARRGFDHMEHLARATAAELGLPMLDVLARRSLRDQRDLSRQDRAANALGSFAVVGPVEGLVLLVDDVLTTGATLEAAACALRMRGASCVLGATVAHAWAG